MATGPAFIDATNSIDNRTRSSDEGSAIIDDVPQSYVGFQG